MKHACTYFLVFLTTILTLSVVAEMDNKAGITLELHRLPKNNDIHTERYRRRRLSAEEYDKPEVVPLHLGLGTHYTWAYVGTPPQRASVIVDTGSSLMAFPCSGCDTCGNHTDQPFNVDNSSTLVYVPCSQSSSFKCKECGAAPNNTCKISQAYHEGSSWQATVVEDVVYLGGDSSFTDVAKRDHYGTYFQFGCQHLETGLFITQTADGIIGLSNTGRHIVSKLHRENKILNNLFSLCFLEDGGTMSIGQPLQSAHRGEISYAKLLSDRSVGEFYTVHLKDVRIGGKSINANEEAFTRGHFLVDSGTTDSYLPRSLQTEFMAMYKEVAGRDFLKGGLCDNYTHADQASLPAIQFVMEAYGDGNEDVILNVSPEQYMAPINGTLCTTLYLTENSGGVIGANLMTNRDVIFDISNQRVGFVDADCAYQGAQNSTAIVSISNATTSSSEGKEKGIAATNVVVPGATSTVADTPVSIAEPTPESASVPAASDPSPIAAEIPLTTVITDVSAMNDASSIPGPQVPVLSNHSAIIPLSPSSAATGDSKAKEKLSETHPMVLTIVGAVLVVGFLLVMFISVRRRRRTTDKKQLWSRVKGDEEIEDDDDDDDEFGLVREEEMKMAMKHEHLDQEVDTDHHQSSSDEEDEEADEVFDQILVQDELEADNARMLELL